MYFILPSIPTSTKPVPRSITSTSESPSKILSVAPPAGNIQIYVVNSTNNTGSSSPATLYAIDDLGMNYTLQDIPKPFFKKYGLVLPSASSAGVVLDGLFFGATADGTETTGDDTDGVRISTITGTAVGNDAGIRTNAGVWHSEWNPYLDVKIQLQGTGSYDTFIGFNSDLGAGAMDGTSTFCNSDTCAGIGIRANTDTTWQYVVNDGDATADFTNSGIANNTSAVRMQVWGEAQNSRFCFMINSNPITCLTTEIPALTTDLGVITLISTVNTSGDTLEYYYLYAESLK